MSGPLTIAVFVVAIIVMILAISRWKVHPFLALMGVSLLFGLVAGIPLVDVKDADGVVETEGLATVIGQGFSGTFTSIGIVIILGALIGAILEATGGALKLADMVVRLVGEKRPALAMQLMGWIVSIPVFCDSGFVILNPIRRAIVQRTAASSVALTMALSGGLYIAHVFIPPTPGPIAAAANLGIGDSLLMVIGMGLAVSILPMIALYFVSRWLGSRVQAADEADAEAVRETYEELVAAQGKLPRAGLTLGPIVLPILAMALGSIATALKWSGPFADVIKFLGIPIIALMLGLIVAIFTMMDVKKLGGFYDLTESTLKTVGPILFITAAGGVLGKVIGASQMVPYIEENAASLATFGIFFPFVLSAILKTAQGSSTVALVTTSSILAPMLPTLGLDTVPLTALAVMAIAAGAMTVSHANDSYFWVVTKFGGMEPAQGYRTQTVMTGILGLTSMVGVLIIWLFLR